MLWQNKSYDLVSYLEIIIGIIALICLLSLLYLWYQPKCQNKFNNIVLVDKVAHLLMSFYQAYLHHLKYNIYDYVLLSSDILLTVVLIFSTFLFINNLEHLLIKKDSKEEYNLILNRVFKAYNCLMVVFIFKDVVLKIVYDFLVDVRGIRLHYHPYTINNLMVTIVLMLLLGLVINFYKKKTT